ncbi:MAG: phosphomannomutase/phosphoglucomutase, partial [Clostridia bacterium]|nr:phosphomannomutase/phosphoglucomutase [Clostridia bacterium]
MNYNQLKSGTDIRGIASDKGGKSVNLTDQAIYDITSAFAEWLKAKENKQSLKIAIGHDSRISADRISAAVKNALSSAGIHIIDCGLASTPAMFMTTVDLGTDGAIQITASHHPFDRNGLKFFTRTGGLESSQLTEIVELANDGNFKKSEGSVTESVNYMSTYAANLRKMICAAVGKSEQEKPLKNYHIVV